MPGTLNTADRTTEPVTRPATVVRFGQPALLVLQATVTEPDGTTGHLAMAMPAAGYGTAPWQLYALLTHLRQLRDAGGGRSRRSRRVPAPGR
ncbi:MULTISPECIES: hypothetical protein [Streptacidiphilus]|uniref:Uncharacterized protein n=1 Tax=Streptacidiphilus cavernicola TaxID=3342716 RepID=A0ABV6UWR8_9ACTN|nr:hypothetical protein [Streptacidiphilus jeojiense]